MGEKRRMVECAIREGRDIEWICYRFGMTVEQVYRLGCVHRWVASPTADIARCALCNREEPILERDGKYIYIDLKDSPNQVFHRFKPWRSTQS